MATPATRHSARDVTQDLERRLRARFAPPAYAYMPQVGDATGVAVGRHADAVVMGLWPSRGLTLMGFEIKAARGDWMRELANPGKAESIAQFCDQWWVVAPQDVVLPPTRRRQAAVVAPGQEDLAGLLDAVAPAAGDVPDLVAEHLDPTVFPGTWGLMVPHGKDQLRTVKAAAQLDAEPIDRAFLAAILRRAAEHVVPRTEIQARIEQAREAGYGAGEEHARSQMRWEADATDRLRRSVEEFETASGIKIDNYNGGQVGEALALFMRLRSARDERGSALVWKIRDARDAFADLAQQMTAVLESEVFNR